MSKDLETIVDGVVRQVLAQNAAQSSPKKKQTLSKMTLSAARELIRAVQTKARDMGVKAVVAVSDAGGNPIAVESMDDAFIAKNLSPGGCADLLAVTYFLYALTHEPLQ